MPTDEEVVRDRMDLEMMQRPHLWPQPNVLFLKRGPHVTERQYAVLHFQAGEYRIVGRPSGGSLSVSSATTPEELVDAGWVVD